MAVPAIRTGRGAGAAAGTTVFGVWSSAFALGVLFHEWQTGAPAVSVHGVAAIAAIAVLLRPTSVLRMLVVLALLAVEFVIDLPNPWNHTTVAGVVGGAVVLWWIGYAVCSPGAARRPDQFLQRIAPFLRTAFIVTWYFAAFAKLNDGFLDTTLTCAMWILDAVPLVSVPDALRPLVIVGTIALELSIPTLLLFRRTRAIAVIAGFAFHLLSSIAGHTAFSGLAWCFYLLFLPAAAVAGAAGLVRRAVGPEMRQCVLRAIRSPLTWVALATCWMLAAGALQMLPELTAWRIKRWLPTLGYTLWMMLWAVLLLRLRRYWLVLTPSGALLRVRQPLFLAVLALIVLSAVSPYIGLKTKYSFTMYSNLHTEPGRWNHLVVPEAVRVFDAQQGMVRFLRIGDPAMEDQVTAQGGHSVVLLDARRLAASYPDAAVTYELDGEVRTADRIADDPVLGRPVSPLVRLLGGFRQVPAVDSCQH
ncbi:HTTM domain-containing protein [Pseudonocardia nigra]|uniref:HTTM domain-containing protein n=1 Tax=Pseudonocardia nigra TaxID=1921578 RepID=UPI001C5D9CF8|nr:HTTM domain-containing protein [Pseudonocardia nigra]